jgi:hypothetical protein
LVIFHQFYSTRRWNFILQSWKFFQIKWHMWDKLHPLKSVTNDQFCIKKHSATVIVAFLLFVVEIICE